MKLNTIKSNAGSTKASRRVGRGNASGHGTYCGRGCKGAGQRKSPHNTAGFEGGQTSLIMRLPKLKGFRNPNKVIYQIINVVALDVFNDGEEVTPQSLLEKKLITKKAEPVKVLGDGKITKKLTVKVHKVSRVAREKIMKAGGKVI